MTRAPDTDTVFEGLVECALKIAQQDAALHQRLKDAIQSDDIAQTLQIACDIVGVKPSSRIRSLIHSRAKAVA